MFLKYCGFQTQDDIKYAVEQHIDAIGFIHYPKSKRHQSIDEIEILSNLVPDTIYRVAVVVNPTDDIINQLLSRTNINAIQFHGDEDREMLRWCKNKYPDVKIIKALPADDTLSKRIQQYKEEADLFIIDTPSIHYGGTGQSFDWQVLEEIQDVPYLVAGGMTKEKIQQFEALHLNAAGYDIASGIETNGSKDPMKMKEISEYIKGEKQI
ncbi:phosphoribosylanthranilate isomerase [Staphylococcus carnosus]|uniref:N-(5'-phosphoribosyl)anthranilate isomerase n=2 Tax=Staphylococcus carnosus TaxID=1281 RepID=TRPF_STACT|nr:phosphoribosylanthranilate isomerase [Staphylococcus carnosus]B9DP52.1 RecName: Full=N-(5'-phosphoribosyl)anthranilate isomerase; Short=PRAI [Staphylococcus carnosus subsp. carnosus TM300]ANZ33417.1 phosphoribosylanthranilate isomerase [Staphylococcus carnosus]KKB26331.1 N-(5'-phosphoribosyl)anthranilate isomerase [Staphylococcus carnosus]KOR13710.1 N-(5'-phosphoribosyl)anthranilate isomerase [Staphylococcus carnosus]POA03011.1 phosphoribosylanthranilate isomerase [Staphylococcus carnosus]